MLFLWICPHLRELLLPPTPLSKSQPEKFYRKIHCVKKVIKANMIRLTSVNKFEHFCKFPKFENFNTKCRKYLKNNEQRMIPSTATTSTITFAIPCIVTPFSTLVAPIIWVKWSSSSAWTTVPSSSTPGHSI